MGLRVATNVASISTQRALSGTSEKQNKIYQRLSTGDRITSSGDDAAGLSISENMRAQIRSLGQAERNTNDGISLVQVAEGGMTETSNILIRMRELAIQAASDTIGDRERGFINQEVQSLAQEVDRIASVSTFNGTPLLNGEGGEIQIQVGIRNDEADRILFDSGANDIQAGALGIDSISTESADDAREMIDTVDEALGNINESRAGLGAMQNKLQSTVNNLLVSKENLAGARSRIADADVAKETSDLIRENVLQSAGVSILAQANAAPNLALRLL